MATSMDTTMEDTTCSISDRASESEGVYESSSESDESLSESDESLSESDESLSESDESLSKSEEVSTVPKRHDVRMLVL